MTLRRTSPASPGEQRLHAELVRADGRRYVSLRIPIESDAEAAELLRRIEHGSDDDAARRRVLASFPDTGSELADLIGDFYTPSLLVEYLGISKQALSAGGQHGRYLRVRTSDGKYVFPAAQFDEHGDVPAGLATVVRALRAIYRNDDNWSAALWLTGPIDPADPDGPTRMRTLRDGDLDRLLVQLREMADLRDVTLELPARSARATRAAV